MRRGRNAHPRHGAPRNQDPGPIVRQRAGNADGYLYLTAARRSGSCTAFASGSGILRQAFLKEETRSPNPLKRGAGGHPRYAELVALGARLCYSRADVAHTAKEDRRKGSKRLHPAF